MITLIIYNSLFFYADPNKLNVESVIVNNQVVINGDLSELNSSYAYKDYTYKLDRDVLTIKIRYSKLLCFSTKLSNFNIILKETNVNQIILSDGSNSKTIYNNVNK